MAEISCPMCGKANPADRDVCQYCEARLKPLTDELSRSQPPIRPGEEPKEVDTGQLESVLPKWLRDIRQQSRESADEEAEQPPAEKETHRQDAGADRLAGLRSSAEDEEEIPSWLAGLRGEESKPSFKEPANEEDDLAALRNMLGEETPSSSDDEESPLPNWMTGLNDAGQGEQSTTDSWSEFREEAAQEPIEQDQPFSASDSDFKWEADFGSASAAQPESTEAEQPFDTDLPAWLRDTDETPAEETGSGLPAWLSGDEGTTEEAESSPLGTEGELPAWLQEKEEPQQDQFEDVGLPAWLSDETPAAPSEGEAATTPPEAGDLSAWLASLGEGEADTETSTKHTDEPVARSTTDWLSSIDKEKTESEPPEPLESAIKSTTDWLSSLDEESAKTPASQEPAQPANAEEMPDWLSSLGSESVEPEAQQEPEETRASTDLPDWLATLGEESAQPIPQEESETPAWLSSFEDEPVAKEDDLFPASDEAMQPSQPAAETGIPDWLATMGETTEGDEQPGEELEPSSIAAEEQGTEADIPSPFVNDEGHPISSEDVDAIFSMGMPDWLSDVQAEAPEKESIGPESEVEAGDELRPAELPSWVQAMRPVESVITETTGTLPEDQPVEERGPLAGLRGVLPAVVGVAPTSKPKAYSIKLQASEDQMESAALLESMLAEEVNPALVVPQKLVLNQRILRWVIAIILLLVVGAAVFLSPQINPVLPSVPPETSDALNYIRDTLPANEPVLLVFDYEAARAGEMEAAAAPLLDQMITLKSPLLTLVSSNPIGSGLAERLMGILLADRPYTRNENMVNLGYLPGGAAGVQAFAGNPVTTKPFTTTGNAAWSTPALQGVSAISDFSAIILLTDNIETARIWIEQTEGLRNDAQLLVVTSAQSGPMIRPYQRSGQVLGMVTGLDNSAPIEQANRGRPGMARRYWDAYGFGLLAAVVMITIGSLWSLVTNLQANRKERGKK